jgi:ribose transport system ATP-binding protein
MSSLSGGNQQKVVLARWLSRKPALLLLDEPTQGVDVGARADAYDIVRTAVSEGLSVLVVSSDLEELAEISDRVVVLSGGRIKAEVSGPELTHHRLTELIFSTKELAP